jgi:3-oxo-5-alpha-steroid 4-dehydrogenase 1
MESPTILLMCYCMYAIPRNENIASLPWGNWTMAGLYIIHYIYRAWLSPLVLNPSMSPIHPIVFFSATAFNTINALSIAGWCAGYGPTTVYDWAGRLYTIEIGLMLWGWSFMGNIFHDDDLREIRRAALRRQREANEKQKSLGKPPNVDKLYMMPKNGLFHYILFPHYLCEWCEWAAFWLIAGWDCVPARNFLVNEISTMTPRALTGYKWYVDRFGKEKVGNRKAVIPGLL